MSVARDTPNGYGWISIALHWSSAIFIFALLFIGDSIGSSATMLGLHTSLAVTVYLLLVARIVWRFVIGHPAASPRQGKRSFTLGVITHYVMLVALGMLLLTGPALAWSAGIPLRLFSVLPVPAPIGLHPTLQQSLLSIHAASATIVAITVTVHLASVFKHLFYNKDETFARMMIPGDQA